MKKSENFLSPEFQNKLVNQLSYKMVLPKDQIQDSYSEVLCKLIDKVGPDFDTINRAFRKNREITLTYNGNKISPFELNNLVYTSVKNRLISEIQSKKNRLTTSLILTDSNGTEFFNPAIQSNDKAYELETVVESMKAKKAGLKGKANNHAERKLVRELMKALKPEQQIYKEFITLNYLLGVKQKDASDLLGIDPRNYRVRGWRLRTQVIPKMPDYQKFLKLSNAVFEAKN